MDILYMDDDIIVCVKPPRVLSTDEHGGLPDLIREALSDPKADIRTVHRLDRVVSGLMVLARNAQAASELSRQIRENVFKKEYLAVVHGKTDEKGILTDLLYRDKARKMTMVVSKPGKSIQEAILHYRTVDRSEEMSCVRVCLVTGRTHQIRVQFASRGLPLIGERKYAELNDECEIALWSCFLGFRHPRTGEWRVFYQAPPSAYPWNKFEMD